MSKSLLGLGIGSSRKKVKITDIECEKYDPNDRNERVYIHTTSDDGAKFKVSEVWIRDHKQEIVPKGLWIDLDHTNTAIRQTTLLARLMQYVGASNTDELLGKELFVEPKQNGFMAIVLYE